MRVLGFRHLASVSGSLLSIAIVVLLAAWAGSQAVAQQPEPAPTPEVANLPAGTELVASADIDLAAGDYEWHVTRRWVLGRAALADVLELAPTG